MPADVQAEVRAMLDVLADFVAEELTALGLPPNASPMFRPFSIALMRHAAGVLVGFSTAGGMSVVNYIDEQSQAYRPAAMVDLLKRHLGRDVTAVVALPLPGEPLARAQIQAAAHEHAKEMETLHVLGRLGDISNLGHLDAYLRAFLADHPDFERNVFVMMRFSDTDQMNEIYESIKMALATRGMTAVRADDRDYTSELWSNIEVYLTCCKFGIAVFEDVDQRDYNPNVSLELGYMMGRGKRTLLLKERRLPRLPSDVVHRLYKEFDIFDIGPSIEREVGRWVDVDLGLHY